MNKHTDELISLFAGRNLEGLELDSLSIAKLNEERYNSTDQKMDKLKQIKDILKTRQHNIRSLKSALQDFERLYTILTSIGISDIDKWFYTFVACTLVAKAGLYNEDENYGMLFARNYCEVLYPGFYYHECMPECIQVWLKKGIWNEDKIKRTIDKIISKGKKTIIPEEMVRTESFGYLEEAVITQGFGGVLKAAYNGELSLNEYVLLICNSSAAREYGFQLPEEIDWKRVEKGINSKIHELIESDASRETHRIIIDDFKRYTEEELKAYELIDNCRKNEVFIYERNKKKYIDLMEKNPDEAFRICMGMKFDTFDEEMANATIQAYEKADNRQKISIVNNFKDMWMIYQPFDKTEKVRIRFYEGFEYMEKRLDSLLEKYEDKKISRQHTKDFISDIEAFLKSSIKES